MIRAAAAEGARRSLVPTARDHPVDAGGTVPPHTLHLLPARAVGYLLAFVEEVQLPMASGKKSAKRVARKPAKAAVRKAAPAKAAKSEIVYSDLRRDALAWQLNKLR